MKIGIDLGTTFSAVARIWQGRPEIIPNREGERLTPSVVLIEKDGSVLVGREAKSQSILQPDSVVMSVKNYMGTKKEFFPADGERYLPEVISSLILRRLVEDAGTRSGEPVDGVVITIPAYFTDAQRKATIDAARLANIPLLAVINEPTAAAVYYTSRQEGTRPMTVMVYDFGGGTFDVSFLTIKGTDIQVLRTGGISRTGGGHLDMKLVDHVRKLFQKKYGIDLRDEEYQDEYQDLILKAETCKIDLSSKERAAISLRVGSFKEKVEIDREFLEAEVRPLYLRTEEKVKRTLAEAGLTFSQLDKVLLVGGTTRIPLIQRSIQALTGIVPSMEVDPSEAVALGAAIYAEHKCTVRDVCSHGIGIAAFADGYQKNHVMIRQNSRLPCRMNESLYTMTDRQSSILVTLTEGESEDLRDITILSEQTVRLPAGLPRGTEVTIDLSLDVNQLLHLRLQIPSVGFSKEYDIERTQNLGEEELKKLQGLALSKNIL